MCCYTLAPFKLEALNNGIAAQAGDGLRSLTYVARVVFPESLSPTSRKLGNADSREGR